MSTAKTKGPGHILVVDDDREICTLIGKFLKKRDYRVTLVGNGHEMRRALGEWSIDLVILDLMLPGEDGLQLCRDLRARSTIPIIMLTVMSEETDRIIGLEMGADDYLAKPFNPRELLARIKAVLRRVKTNADATSQTRPRTLYFSGWRLEIGRRQFFSPNGLLVDLSGGEFDLLVVFAEHPQQVLTREQLLDLTHGRSQGAFDRSIDMQISRLRRKIEISHSAPELIMTVRGGGYSFTSNVSQHEPSDP
ncbi:MAG: response regulator [Alphaproteobacteria bacterium]|nr:response regulator [Alphaproteobacteria bacterium]